MISVVIPSYNAARWLAGSLDSIFAQTVAPGEVVVVDDGSTDDTPAILRAYGDRLHVVRGTHGGLAAARNLGLAVARGDWIAFHDADDLALPDRLAVLLDHLQRSGGSDGVFADGARLDDGARLTPRALAARVSGRALTAADLFAGFPAYFQGALIARDAFAAAGAFDPAFPVHPDHDYAFRLFARARLTYLDRVVFHYRRHETNMTANQVGARLDLARTLERLRTDDPAAVALIGARSLDAALARHWYRIGRTQVRRGDERAAGAAFDRAVALAPLRPAYRWRRWLAGPRGVRIGSRSRGSRQRAD
jgi:glycosyltransferase involved in cell wall biosynthesis